MNKNEFYKQLMSEYSFDAEKIKNNARKGRFAGHKSLPMYIGVTAAAAALVVTVGTALFMTLNRGENGVVLRGDDDLMSLSAAERLRKALEEIERNSGSAERYDVLVTFTAPISPDAARQTLTRCSEESVPVKFVYLEDGTKISGEKWIEAAFNGESKFIGAAINCAGADMALLQEDETVFAVEIIPENELDAVSPIDTETGETQVALPPGTVEIDVPPPVSIPDEDTIDSQEPNDTIESTSGTVTVETSQTESAPETESETIAPESMETSETIEETVSEVITETPTPPVTESTYPEPNVPESEDIPAVNPEVDDPVEETGLPDGVTLPENVKKLSYKTGFIGAENAFFIKDDVMFVKTADKISLYRFDGIAEREIVSTECIDAKIHWMSESGSRMIVSGTYADGKRSRLFYVNADGDNIIDLGAEDVVMDGTLAGVGYNDSTGLLVLNVKENGMYYVCALRLNDNNKPAFVSNCFETSAKVMLLASEGEKIYLAAVDGNLTQIYRVDSSGYESALIKTYDNDPKLATNLAFTHAVISPPDGAVIGFVEIFDPRSESFVSTGSFDAAVNFGISRHNYSDNGKCYTINGGALETVSGIDVFAQIEYRRSLSSRFAAEAADGCVEITDSEYSQRVRNGMLTFGELSDSAEDIIREAVNGAIGVNNMLAENNSAECGIDSDEKLLQCVKAYYSENAAAKILEMKDSGGLIPISVSDTVLTVSENGSSAVGVLYVRAGTYAKKIAYLSYNINLVYENSSWKLDCVIG